MYTQLHIRTYLAIANWHIVYHSCHEIGQYPHPLCAYDSMVVGKTNIIPCSNIIYATVSNINVLEEIIAMPIIRNPYETLHTQCH